MKAVVTGSAGQDGFYMCKYLIKLGYEVFSIDIKYDEELKKLNVNHFILDITNVQDLNEFLKITKPDEIYNFGGNSNNLEAFNKPFDLLYANTIPIITILDYIKKYNNICRLFQASSSLIFGEEHELDQFQTLDTLKNPTTPYGCSKLYAYNIINTYRKHYNIFAINGILYNHESTRRKDHFIIPKIVKNAINIKHGIENTLEIGNIKNKRSWIHAKDVVDATYKSLQYNKAKDWIICGDSLESVEYVLEYVFKKLNLDYHKYIKTNFEYNNIKQENNYLGDNEETKKLLNWNINYSLENILDELIQYYEL
jgi:GDPmannose 4,6-dehydratase